MKSLARAVCFVSILCLVMPAIPLNAQENHRRIRQGYSMRMWMDNRGALGRVVSDTAGGPGLEYPVGSGAEHVFGAGLWVGGKLDTAVVGNSPPVTLVTTAYEGWVGPYFEFFPGPSAADSIWQVSGRGTPRPSEWNGYWGNLIPPASFSDNDDYCLYDDSHVQVANHIPLHLKVAQSSFVWQDSYADGIDILEYRIVNTGVRQIDSAYVGLFLDGDVGSHYPVLTLNYAGSYPDIHLAYIADPLDIGVTPVGLVPIASPVPLDSLRQSFRWWNAIQSPSFDVEKYEKLSQGVIDTDGAITSVADVRCLMSLGPFTIRAARVFSS